MGIAEIITIVSIVLFYSGLLIGLWVKIKNYGVYKYNY